VGDPAYPWEEAILLSPEKAIENAETYAFYAFLVRLADKDYRLRMDAANCKTKKEILAEGTFYWDQNLERVGGQDATPPM
jgi:hypothetical protein